MIMAYREDIGAKIREIRKKQGMTQQQLADLCGIKRTTICKIESGKFNASLDILERICAPIGARLVLVCDD